ncbi:hypothetical protein Mp_1g03350 [Marchantia polymorpha subsp. ruderalis]|uniref:Uncharacterized protein n=2 Tax=Marchantia polymorpha TaxID=3197 RepID=A0AAF6AL24_MARPO|nr:hypothetical protein MARPO_0005s0272 [Marchantia polymorpha]BBM97144.1 hypothetical protein Mp_1g03350 [Marchantia polymorpha subsp. ruderalis]|eukprot:PTQ48661.1 hypothetical protein MARPO_0005s0272 [Marchantia polymorpha]
MPEGGGGEGENLRHRRKILFGKRASDFTCDVHPFEARALGEISPSGPALEAYRDRPVPGHRLAAEFPELPAAAAEAASSLRHSRPGSQTQPRSQSVGQSVRPSDRRGPVTRSCCSSRPQATSGGGRKRRGAGKEDTSRGSRSGTRIRVVCSRQDKSRTARGGRSRARASGRPFVGRRTKKWKERRGGSQDGAARSQGRSFDGGGAERGSCCDSCLERLTLASGEEEFVRGTRLLKPEAWIGEEVEEQRRLSNVV